MKRSSKAPDIKALEGVGDVPALIAALHFTVPEDLTPLPSRERRKERWRQARYDASRVREAAARALAKCAKEGNAATAAVAALVEATQQGHPEFMNVHAAAALKYLTGKNEGFAFWPAWWREREDDFVQTMREDFRRRRRRELDRKMDEAQGTLPKPPPLIAAYFHDHAGGDATMPEPPGLEEFETRLRAARSQLLARVRSELEPDWQAQEGRWRREEHGPVNEEHELPTCPHCHAPLRPEFARRSECLYCAGALEHPV